jgi:hypothetical protein
VRHPGLGGSFWPSPTQEALLRLVRGPTNRAAAIWRELQPIDVGDLETGSFCVLPLLYESLVDVAPEDPRLQRLLGTYRSTWYKNQLALERLAATVARFREEAVETMLVGAMAIALRWYPRLGCRPVPQLDLMVDADSGPGAREAARGAGWRPAGRSRGQSRFVDGDGRALVVYECAPPLIAGPVGTAEAYASFVEAAERLAVLEESVLVLQPSDELLFICALGARTVAFPSVQWLLDVSKLLASPGGPTAVDAVARARAFHLVEPLRDTVRYLASVSGTSGLDDHLELLAAEKMLRRDSLAYRLGGASTNRLGGVSLTLGSHLRASAAEPIPRLLARFPRHLQETWELESVRHVPVIALKKLTRLARRRRLARRASRQPASTASERNRSASS